MLLEGSQGPAASTQVCKALLLHMGQPHAVSLMLQQHLVMLEPWQLVGWMVFACWSNTEKCLSPLNSWGQNLFSSAMKGICSQVLPESL